MRGLGRKGVLSDVSFDVRRGEVLGLAGLVGAGRTEIARCIFGADRHDTGAILLDGRPVTIRSPRDAIRLGIGYVPEDRKLQGLFLHMTVRDNIAMSVAHRMTHAGILDRGAVTRVAASYRDRLSVRPPHLDVPVNRTDGIAFMGGAQNTNEECYLFQKAARLLGTAFVEHQARL